MKMLIKKARFLYWDAREYWGTPGTRWNKIKARRIERRSGKQLVQKEWGCSGIDLE